MSRPHDQATLPLPGEQYDGRIVVASVYVGDLSHEDYDDWLLLTLDPAEPFYRVTVYDGRTGSIKWSTAYDNIVPAVREYESQGGDY